MGFEGGSPPKMKLWCRFRSWVYAGILVHTGPGCIEIPGASKIPGIPRSGPCNLAILTGGTVTLTANRTRAGWDASRTPRLELHAKMFNFMVLPL